MAVSEYAKARSVGEMAKIRKKITYRSPNLRSRKRVTQVEHQQAIRFLKYNPWGKRLHRIENTLILLQKNAVPRFKGLITNTSYDLREIIQNKKFLKTLNKDAKKPSDSPGSDLISSLNNYSESQVLVKVKYENFALKFYLYHTRDLEDNAKLYGSVFGQIVAATLAALGVDMSGFPVDSANVFNDENICPKNNED